MFGVAESESDFDDLEGVYLDHDNLVMMVQEIHVEACRHLVAYSVYFL